MTGKIWNFRETEIEMKFVIVTNNPKVRDDLGSEFEVDFADITYREVLCKVRDMIYEGHKLLTHPLSGSVKPGETPYKSVLMLKGPKTQGSAGEKGAGADSESVKLIESALSACEKFADKSAGYAEKTLKDLQLIDLDLIKGAIASAYI